MFPCPAWRISAIAFFLCCALGTPGAQATLPATTATLPEVQVEAGSTVERDLRDYFGLPGVAGDVVQVETNFGRFNMQLLPNDAPATVANFRTYLQSGAYQNALFHRLVRNFVLQTGGFTAAIPPGDIPANAPVVNEFKVPNTRGTVAMAKLTGNPDSATNQWFVNLVDNRANLDSQNGGFTVFARVLGTGMTVVDAISGLPTYNVGSPFNTLPLHNVLPGQDRVKLENMVFITRIFEIPVYPSVGVAASVLRFAAYSSNPAVVATVEGSTLRLTRAEGTTAGAWITVQALDTHGNVASQHFPVPGAGPLPPPPAADAIAPVLTVSAPAPGARINGPTAAFTGRITEAGGFPRIEFSTNGGASWTEGTVSGTRSPYTWSASVPLVPGTNSVQLRATDRAGNRSAVLTRPLVALVASTTPLSITPSGTGTFTSGLSGRRLNLNLLHTVTATPGPGQIFLEWRRNGAAVSRDPTLTFLMEEGVVLTPVFIPNPYPAVAGTYNGLVGQGAPGTDTAANRTAYLAGRGFLTVTTTGTGQFTGSLRLDGQTIPLAGKFDGYGETVVVRTRPGKSAVQVSLKLTTTGEGTVSGTVVVAGGGSFGYTLRRSTYAGTPGNRHPLAGTRHTLLLASAAGWGHGWAMLTVAANGTATLAGKLADGTAWTAGPRLTSDGGPAWRLPVHLPLYAGAAGVVWGDLAVVKDPVASGSDVTGNLGWLRPANSKAVLQPAGSLGSLDLVGTRLAMSPGISAWSGGTSAGSFQLGIDPAAGLLPAALVHPGNWPSSNAPSLTKPAPSGLTFSFSAATGQWRGNFPRSMAGRVVSTAYEGVLFGKALKLPGQDTEVRGGGFFLTGPASGSVVLREP